MKHLLSAAVLAVLGVTPLAAHAQFAKSEDAVKYRKSALSLLGTHFGRVGAVVKGEKPFDKAGLEADAAVIEMLSRMPWSAFPPGSDTPDSRAQPEIWKEQARFKERAEKMQAEVLKLSAAAKTGDLAAIKASFGATGQSCKACHDDFRKK